MSSLDVLWGRSNVFLPPRYPLHEQCIAQCLTKPIWLALITQDLPPKNKGLTSHCVGSRDELQEYDPFDEGVFCRSRFWMFISYLVSFASIIGSVWVLLGKYALNTDATNVWPGIAGLFQVTLILGSALLFFVARTPGSDSSYGAYGSF